MNVQEARPAWHDDVGVPPKEDELTVLTRLVKVATPYFGCPGAIPRHQFCRLLVPGVLSRAGRTMAAPQYLCVYTGSPTVNRAGEAPREATQGRWAGWSIRLLTHTQ